MSSDYGSLPTAYTFAKSRNGILKKMVKSTGTMARVRIIANVSAVIGDTYEQIPLSNVVSYSGITPETSKDPGPEGPALVYPWKGVVYIAIFLREYWSAGVLACPGATCRNTSKV